MEKIFKLKAWPRHESSVSRYMVDANQVFDEDSNLLEFNGVKFLSRKDVHLLAGLPKCGKSTFAWEMAAALVCGERLGLKSLESDCSVLIVDTEQAPADVARRARIFEDETGLPVHGQPTDRLQVLRLRKPDRDDESASSMDVAEWRMTVLESALSERDFDLLILDGVADVCTDLMDSGESVKTCQKLMTLAEEGNCAILVLLHLNKANLQARGHLGQQLERACSDFFIVTNESDTTGQRFQRITHQLQSRHQSFGNLTFSFGNDGRAVPITPRSSFADECERLQSVFNGAFSQKKELRTAELKKELVAAGIPERSAERAISRGLTSNMISRPQRGLYCLSAINDFKDIQDDFDGIL